MNKKVQGTTEEDQAQKPQFCLEQLFSLSEARAMQNSLDLLGLSVR